MLDRSLSPDFVSLQLTLVERSVELGLGSIADGVHQLSNLQRRLGLGTPTDPPSDSRWLRLLEELDSLRDHDDRVNAAMEASRAAPPAVPEHTAREWPTVGAFSLEVRGAVAQTHFFAMDTDDVSPLARTKLEQRRSELSAVIAGARRDHPDLETIIGGSWLYSTASYTSLFPIEHVRTATVRRERRTFRGMSHWGQFLDHRGSLRANLADVFRARVAEWRGDDPCALFPIATLEVSSSIESFGPFGSAKAIP